MTKEYGIGWTIIEFNGKNKKHVDSFKAIPGNMEQAARLFEKRIRSINKEYVVRCSIAAFCYGMYVRWALLIWQFLF